jgi:hypothetical protein
MAVGLSEPQDILAVPGHGVTDGLRHGRSRAWSAYQLRTGAVTGIAAPP